MARIGTDQAKAIVLDKIAAGMKVAEAMASVGRSVETYRSWRKEDERFRTALSRRRDALAEGKKAASEVPDFPEFCERYLHQPLPMQHLRIWDVIQGREPRDFWPSMQYQPGAWPGRYMLINIPPDHAKSTTWTVKHSIYLIAQNPDIRIGIVSKSQSMAKKFLGQIKFYLANPSLFPELHAAFAPEGGWRSEDKSDGLAWRDNMIYIRGRTQPEKEPTVEALGIGSHLYGTRFDLIILDDVEDMSSAGQFEQHADWIGQEVFNRLHPDHGRLLVLGTRVGAMDVYRKLRDDAVTEDGEPFYTYFAQPAVLEGETEHSDNWTVLWPERLDAKKIARARAAMTDPRRFTFVYQQRDVALNQTFPDLAVDASINHRRFKGPMTAGGPGHRLRGQEGLYVVAGLDPATVGATAAVVVGTDREERRRWVLDCFNQRGTSPERMIRLIKDWTDEFRINEWRIERNAFQRFLTQLPELQRFMASRGVLLREHNTNKNKFDEDFGVHTMAPLFLGCIDTVGDRVIALPDGTGPIELPALRNSPATSTLAQQLKLWEPDMPKSVPTDLVMALWFAELGVRQYLLGSSAGQSHMKSKFTLRRDARRRGSYSFAELQLRGLVNAA